MSPGSVDYMQIEDEIMPFNDYRVVTTTGTKGWNLFIGVDPASDYHIYRDKIEKALGSSHYVQNNRLYRR